MVPSPRRRPTTGDLAAVPRVDRYFAHFAKDVLMQRMWLGLLCLAMWVATPGAAHGQIDYDSYRLPNGLRVILVEDHSAPIVTVSVWYHVGSANEVPGRSGFAHLFEHMMFQGSANVQKREHTNRIQRAGGTVNGTTNEDRTSYFETLPSNRLNLGLWLEADRMRSLAVTAENFENQREVVKEERRLRVDNQPYVPALVEGSTLLFDSTDCFAYAHSVIGSMDDLNDAQIEDVKAFFDLYYVPNNATLTLVGDFDPAEARRLIEQYFSAIPRGAAAPSVDCGVHHNAGPRIKRWEDPLANLPAVIVGYVLPPHREADTRALQHLSAIVGGGESSRMNRALVREARTALQAGAQLDTRQHAGVFLTFAIANQGVSADTLQAQLEAEVARVRADGVTEAELTKAKNRYRASDTFGRQTTLAIANELQHFAHYHATLDEIHEDADAFQRVTATDLQRVARTYLVPENSLTIVIVPATQAPGAGGTER